MTCSEGRIEFTTFKETLVNTVLPSDRWCYFEGDEKFFGFLKVEDDITVKKKVIILNDLKVKIFIGSIEMPISTHVHFKTIEELVHLLEAVDNSWK